MDISVRIVQTRRMIGSLAWVTEVSATVTLGLP